MLRILDQKTEYKVNPLGMDETHPRFSYRLEGAEIMQTSRRIRVTEESGRIVWDSGDVRSGTSIQIGYAGEALKPFTKYFWQVEVTADDGSRVESAGGAFFETGFLGTDWGGTWISGNSGIGPYRPAIRLAKTFSVAKTVKKARLYATALGLYTAYLNGRRVTEDLFTPGWTQYFHRVQYQAYDVTDLLLPGSNALAAKLGDGWFCGVISYVDAKPGGHSYGTHPLFRAELHVEYEDGTQDVIPTNKSWKNFFLYPATLENDIYLGESYDGDADDIFWKLPDASGGAPACEKEYNTAVVWNSGEPVRVMHTLSPVRLEQRIPGTWIADFGQNLTGRVRLRIPAGNRGASIVVKHGEVLNKDGSLYRTNLLFAKSMYTVTCGGGALDYAPEFSFYGFRYAEISGFPGELKEDMISAECIYSGLPETGSFTCSSPLLSRFFRNVVWSQRDNFLDVPTDCPQRCERFGWTGDAQVFINAATFNMYSPAFYTKWMEDVLLSSHPHNGTFPLTAPYPAQNSSPQKHSAGWSDAGLIIPWHIYLKYGDLRMIQRYIPAMRKYLDYAVNETNGTFLPNHTINDHLNLNAPTSPGFTAGIHLYSMNLLLSRMERLTGNPEAAAEREELAGRILEVLRKTFFTESGELKEKTQTAAVFALLTGLCPDDAAREKVKEFLVHDITVTRNNHLSTGFLGTPLILYALSENGALKTAYDLLEQTSYPSWLYAVTQGATTIWERWNGYTAEDGFYDPEMNSFNHYAFGAAASWLFEGVAGIRPPENPAPEDAGFRKFVLAPVPGGTLEYAEAEYVSSYGKIVSGWKKQQDSLEWHFTVPCSSEAELVFPAGEITPAPESVKGITVRNGKLAARPGNYTFNIKIS